MERIQLNISNNRHRENKLRSMTLARLFQIEAYSGQQKKAENTPAPAGQEDALEVGNLWLKVRDDAIIIADYLKKSEHFMDE